MRPNYGTVTTRTHTCGHRAFRRRVCEPCAITTRHTLHASTIVKVSGMAARATHRFTHPILPSTSRRRQATACSGDHPGHHDCLTCPPRVARPASRQSRLGHTTGGDGHNGVCLVRLRQSHVHLHLRISSHFTFETSTHTVAGSTGSSDK
jgi:hypothetical protein